MDKVAKVDNQERAIVFQETSARTGIQPGLVEKDFWVCWTLKQLFSIPNFESRLLFKGGTTLSKIFGVIQRFSEDIDMAVDYVSLGFTGDRDPLAPMSNTKRTKLLDEMLAVCREYIAGDFLSSLRSRMSGILPSQADWDLYVDPEDGHIVNFRYPTAVEQISYVRPEVRLELGTHAEFIPNDHYTVRPYAAEEYPEAFDHPDCTVRAIKIERTFWEKLTILHQEHFRTSDRGEPSRFSRHYYDTYMMVQHSEDCRAALQSPELLHRVVEHKKRFYPRRWARYDLAAPATLQLMPSNDWLDYLRHDYETMQVMIFGDSPSFDEILDGLQALEGDIRRMPALLRKTLRAGRSAGIGDGPPSAPECE
jgi:hypothetical protein